MRPAFCVLVLLTVVGCGVGHDSKAIDEARLDELLLQPTDVDSSFRPTFVRNQSGRLIAEVRYRQVPSSGTASPLTIVSLCALHPSSDVAEDNLDSSRKAVARKEKWQPIDEPGLGEESFAATILQAGARLYEVFWREANATAALRVRALEDKLPLGDVLELARKQERRLHEAAS